MAQQRRPLVSNTQQRTVGSGPYLAKIISHLDPTFSGALEVTLLRNQGNSIGDDTQTYVVRCAQPFFGYTGFEFMGQNTTANKSKTNEAYNDTQKSYGMWFVPPDVGVTVIVVFIDGDPAQGFWIGCVPSRFANHMTPAIGGSTEVDIDEADKKKYNWPNAGTGLKMPLPVAEANRRINAKDQQIDVEKIKKPLHPIAERFLEQGLLEDDVRGTTTSSSRREVPSMVFGISTPGPLDRRTDAKRAKIGTIQNPTERPVPVSRLGGTQFVMDDGDDRYQRATPAGVGPVKYASVLDGEKGEPTIPYNEYFRVRTRTGHQLLMHNSEDLIYIGNSRGTTWIELTSNGKIDIYAEDSISIHTQNDLNIRADRDINMEAGRNINMKTVTGRWHTDVATDWKVTVGRDNKITIGREWEHVVGGNSKITTSQSLDVLTGGNNAFSASGNTDIATGGIHKETAADIHMNGPVARVATAAIPIEQLSLHQNPVTNVAAGWDKKYQDSTIASIMKRVPMHEPWLLHENQAPQLLTPNQTDREV